MPYFGRNKDSANNNTIKTKSINYDEAKNIKNLAIWKPSNLAINVIRYLSQAITGAAEFYGTILLLGGGFTFLNCLVASLVVAAIEVLGIGVLIKSLVQNIVFKNSSNAAQKKSINVEIGIASFVVLSVLVLNGFLGYLSNNKTFDSSMNDAKITAITDTLNSNIAQLKKRCDMEIKTTKENYQKSLKVDIDLHLQSVATLKESRWVKGANKKKINKNIESTIANFEEQKKALKAAKDKEVSLFVTDKEKAIEGLKSAYDGKIKLLNGGSDKTSFTNSFAFILLMLLNVVSVVCVIFSVHFHNANKQKFKIEEKEGKNNLLNEYFILSKDLLYHLAYIPFFYLRRLINFKYKELENEKRTFEGLTAPNLSGLNLGRSKGKDNVPAIAQQNTIGFKTGVQNTGSRAVQNTGISNCATTELQAKQNSENSNKEQLLSKYNISTLKMQYKRSDLVKKSLSKDKKTQERNRLKYEEGKHVLEPLGVRFIETRTGVKIKL